MSERRRLPTKRRCATVVARVKGHKVYLNVGYYPDGTPGEVFIDVDKVGAFSRGMVHCLARLMSLALQHGVPVAAIVKLLKDARFEPAGEVEGHPAITQAKSIVDYVARALDWEVKHG